MPNIVGVRFKRCGKVYDFEACEEALRKGDTVVVESSFGLTLGSVVTEACGVENTEKTLKKIVRAANEADLKVRGENTAVEAEAKRYCSERIASRGLQMKLVYVESTLDKKRVVFYFTADGRIDFRELVKDLASKFRTRIEMRQIGVRDETKFIGGLGVCGREVCCRTFLSNFTPISIKMAKKQELALNPGKLSGLCGRLMCCLGFEMGGGTHACAAIETASEAEDFVLVEEDAPDADGGAYAGEGFELSMAERALASHVMIDRTPGGQAEAAAGTQPEKSQPDKSQTGAQPPKKSRRDRSRRDRSRKEGRPGERPRTDSGRTPVDAVGRTHTDAVGRTHTDAVGRTHTDAVGRTHTDAVGRTHTDAVGRTHGETRGGVEQGKKKAANGTQRSPSNNAPRPKDAPRPPASAGARPPASIGATTEGAPSESSKPADVLAADDKAGQARSDRKRRWRNKRGKKNKKE
jgi:cell fate regulator YaaT (PSP1 superfamily)